jgi:hypothetical protein
MNTRKLHKKAGIFAGLFLLILSLTGFFLNHDQWKFQYQWTQPNSVLPDSVAKAEKSLFQTKAIHPEEVQWHIVGGMRGAFVSLDGGGDYQQTSTHQFYALRWLDHVLYGATEDGILRSEDYGLTWQSFALSGRWVNALAADGDKLFASVDKSHLVLLTSQAEVLSETTVALPEDQLAESITLSRFVRDFHYGRGLFDDGWSLLLNDIATWLLVFSALSGTWIWWSLRRANNRQQDSKGLVKWIKKIMAIHSHGLVLLAIPFLLLFALTGIVLDHSKFFNKPLKQVVLPIEVLPPVYSTLQEDIWSVDVKVNTLADTKVASELNAHQATTYRFGNRYGVYESTDLSGWHKVSDGFAYRMTRLSDTLYVSGMGSPSRIYTDYTDWLEIKAPRMFRDVYQKNYQAVYFKGHGKSDQQVPNLTDSSFYSIMLTLHDGTFFAGWWVWVNDFASLLLIVLLVTGLIRWQKKPSVIKRLLKR